MSSAQLLKHEIGQLFIIGISGHQLTNEEKEFIVKNNIGGVILFSRNVSTPEQVRNLCAEIQSLRHQQHSRAPLWISIDMEGGRVARLKKPFTEWPPLKYLGDRNSKDLSRKFAQAMGKELRAVGINLDYAPCIDVFSNPKNTVIGDRAVSTDPHLVAEHVLPLIQGYRDAKVLHCIKHFPGHGHTVIDSHYDLPIETADWKKLTEVELVPFLRAFKDGAELLMTAHIRFDSIDSEFPVTLSEKFLKNILRDQLNYKGLVMTDDLDMKALAKYHEVEYLPVRALQAGANIILYCNEPESHIRGYHSVERALLANELDLNWIQYSLNEMSQMKSRYLAQPEPLGLSEVEKIVGHPEHQQLSQVIRGS